MTNVIGRREALGTGAALALVAAVGSEANAQSKPSSRLTTHVLDTYSGIPGEGVTIEFYKWEGDQYALQKSVTTNHDGRAGEPLLPLKAPRHLVTIVLCFTLPTISRRSAHNFPTRRLSIRCRWSSPYMRRKSTTMCRCFVLLGATRPIVGADLGSGRCHVDERRARQDCVSCIFKRPQLPRDTYSSPRRGRFGAFELM